MVFQPRAVASKPHGSLDWYARAGRPIRYAGELPGVPRLIIPPGRNKSRLGYEQPFDRQRERANKAIDGASRLLILGYGFAEEHLETHLRPALTGGRPALILTYALSDSIRSLVRSCPAVERIDEGHVRVFRGGAVAEALSGQRGISDRTMLAGRDEPKISSEAAQPISPFQLVA